MEEDLREHGTRLTELELKYMEQVRFVEALSDVIASQQKQIDELTKRLERLREHVLVGPDGMVVNERPPHY